VHEDDVRLLPDYAAKDVKKAPLVWFSFVSEAFFSRWSVLCLLATAGGLVLFAGLTIISLALHPSVRLLREGEADTTRPSTPVS
jgi:hypothetical protein